MNSGLRLPRSRSTKLVAVALVSLSSGAAAQPPAVTCSAGVMSGLDADQVRSVTLLVCREIAKSAEDQSDAAGDYKVSAVKLDRTLILTIDVARPTGNDGRSLQLSSIDEVPDAAPALAHALVLHNAAPRVEKHETRESEPPPRSSLGFWSFGLGGVSHKDEPWPRPVLLVAYRREVKRYALMFDERMFVASKGSDGNVSLGGRRFFWEGSTSPFLGGGFGWGSLATNPEGPAVAATPTTSSQQLTVEGPMAYVEGGFEFVRLSGVRLDAFVRLDAPFVRATSASAGGPSPRYLLPVLFGATFGL